MTKIGQNYITFAIAKGKVMKHVLIIKMFSNLKYSYFLLQAPLIVMEVLHLGSLTKEAPLSLLPAISQLAASWHTASLHMENGLQAGMQGCWLTYGTTHKNTLTPNNVVWPHYNMGNFRKILTKHTPHLTNSTKYGMPLVSQAIHTSGPTLDHVMFIAWLRKAPSEPMLTYHQGCFVAFIHENKFLPQEVLMNLICNMCLEITLSKFLLHLIVNVLPLLLLDFIIYCVITEIS